MSSFVVVVEQHVTDVYPLQIYRISVADGQATLLDEFDGAPMIGEQRIFRGLEFYFWVAAPELHTYLQLASPISGIVEERPDYSNITGGYGLMSSRMYRIVPDEAQGGNLAQRKLLTASSN